MKVDACTGKGVARTAWHDAEAAVSRSDVTQRDVHRHQAVAEAAVLVPEPCVGGLPQPEPVRRPDIAARAVEDTALAALRLHDAGHDERARLEHLHRQRAVAAGETVEMRPAGGFVVTVEAAE